MVCVSAPALAQQWAANPAITGQVLTADGETALRRARVEVTRGSWRAEPMLTDNDGRFAIRVEGAGPFSITVTKGGYVVASTAIPENTPIPLVVRLQRASAISGFVVDVNGLPALGARVSARRLDEPLDGVPPQTFADTDDRGEYRLSGLAAGRYEISTASPLAPRQTTDAPVYPVVTIRAGDDIHGVQLTASDTMSAMFLRGLAASLPEGRLASMAGIRGRVLTDSGNPVAGAIVRVTGPATDARLPTDADGSYVIPNLRPGPYMVSAARDGYESREYGQQVTGESGKPVPARAGAVTDGIDIVLPRGAALSGVIVDEHGEPLQGVGVRALRVEYSAGRLSAVAVGAERRTDDRGSYRLWGLQAGTYIVAASVDGVISGAPLRQNAMPLVYFPGTPSISAAIPIEVRDDAVANLALNAIPLTQIIGAARDGDVPLVSGTARLIESRRSVSAISAAPRTAEIGMDGSFTFRSVAPGEYILQVLGNGPGRTGLFGVREVSVGSDPIDVTMTASHGTSIEGRFVFDGSAPPRFALRPVTLDERARAEATIAVNHSQMFAIGLFGRTAFALSEPVDGDWYLKSISIGDTDVTDTGFDFGARPDSIEDVEIVLSDRGARVSGDVVANGTANKYAVVVFPQARERRFPFSRWVKFVRSAQDGSFRVNGLPPGDYFIAAVNRLEGTWEAGEWQNPDVLAQIESRSQRVTLSGGQTRTVTLRLIER